jgi:hypothetical protein
LKPCQHGDSRQFHELRFESHDELDRTRRNLGIWQRQTACLESNLAEPHVSEEIGSVTTCDIVQGNGLNETTCHGTILGSAESMWLRPRIEQTKHVGTDS